MHISLKHLCERAPILVALSAQVVAFVLVHLLHQVGFFAWFTMAQQWWMVHGLIAAAVARIAGLPWWWGPIQVALPFAVMLSLSSAIPAWIYGVLFLLVLLVFGGGVLTRVPLYLSNQAAADALAELLKNHPAPAVVDLGAGLGGPLRSLAARIPGGRYVNVEASPITALVCRVLAGRRGNITTRWSDLFAQDLAAYDLIYAFLSPAPMADLWKKVQAEAKPGAGFVSNTFVVPGITPERIIDLPGRSDARLYVYVVPGR